MIDKKPTSEPGARRSKLTVWVSIMVLCLAAVLCYFLLDERVFSRFVEYPNNWDENNWLRALKRLGKAYVLIWLLLLWVCVARRAQPGLIGLVALLLLVPMVPSLKVLVGRPRPREVKAASSGTQENNGLNQSPSSFPSGDTANVFAVGTALVPFVAWPWIPVIFIVASSVALLRVTTLAHYPSDVCAGAAIGIFCGWLALHITRQWLLLEPSRFKWYRGIAGLGIILMPGLISLFERPNPLLIFLKTYGVLIVGIYVITKAGTWSKWLGRRDAHNP